METSRQISLHDKLAVVCVDDTEIALDVAYAAVTAAIANTYENVDAESIAYKFQNSQEALSFAREALRREMHVILVTDGEMPDLNGEELVNELLKGPHAGDYLYAVLYTSAPRNFPDFIGDVIVKNPVDLMILTRKYLRNVLTELNKVNQTIS